MSIQSFAGNACGQGGGKKFAVLETQGSRRSGANRVFLGGSARAPQQKLHGAAGSRRVHEDAAERAHGDHAQEQADEGGLGGDSEEVLKEVLVLDEKISESCETRQERKPRREEGRRTWKG